MGDPRRARYTYIQLRVQQFAQATANPPPPARGLTASSPPRNPLQPGRPSHNGASHGDHAQSMSALAPKPADFTAAVEDPDQIRKITRQFNWGAALLPFLWCLFNTRGWYWALAVAGNVLIPWLGWLVTGIVFGLFGSRWSWASKDWDSFEAFQRSQTGWTVGGIVFAVTVFVLLAMAGG